MTQAPLSPARAPEPHPGLHPEGRTSLDAHLDTTAVWVSLP
jgi:hypothetical protein